MKTIIVVDDDKVFRELLTTILALEGYRTVVIPKPDEVISKTRQSEPALVLMDVFLGDEDTLDVLRELKQEGELKDIPVIMTSGMDRSAECLGAGADSFVLKPFRPSDILDEIETLLQQ